MKWSKLKSLVEARFADSLKGRINIFSTRYGNCHCGRAWLTFDGREIANFCTRANANVKAKLSKPSKESLKKFNKLLVEYGELSRQDAYQSCWAFIHELTIEQALNDTDLLVQALAILDSRVGKRRLEKLERDKMHPLVQSLFDIRLEVEGYVSTI